MLMPYHEPAPEAVGPLENLLDTLTVNKVVFIDEPGNISNLRRQLSRQIGRQVTLVQALDTMLEVLPQGASKGDGLRRLLDFLSISPDHVLAIGDGENDIGMLQLARIGVAMGNAPQEVKAAADYVAGTNDADGVAEAVERFVLDTTGAYRV
jgi:Cof subfamily protein (haloacid dehalogenase superfamily)